MSNPDDALDKQINSRLALLSLRQKIRLISGASYWCTAAEPDIGLDPVIFSDGPIGVRGATWDERSPSICLPSPSAIAATWDEGLVGQLARLLAAEAHRKGVHVVLGPTLNLHRSPLGGRHFECLSEDPLLSGRLGAAYVRALQSCGVAAAPKHYVANDSEAERFTVNVTMTERTLREIYLLPFEYAVSAGAWLVMSAYNRVNGETMTESSLLHDPLKREWGFDGVVVSDWLAVRSTVAAGNAGNDLAMPGPASVWTEPLVVAVRKGKVSEKAIDDKVRRILRLARRVGALTDAGSPAAYTPEPLDYSGMLRQAASAGMVLLRNEGNLLPLDKNRLSEIALIGPNAAAGQIHGGGSSAVSAEYVVSPIAGIRSALADSVPVTHHIGVDLGNELPAIDTRYLRNPETGKRGVHVRFIDNQGVTVRTENRDASQLVWLDEDFSDVATIAVHTRLRVPTSGVYRVGVAGNGPIRSLGTYRLYVDEHVVVDEFVDTQEDGQPGTAALASPNVGEVKIAANDEVDLVLTHGITAAAAGVPTGISLTLVLGEATTREDALAAATSAASRAAVTIVVVGTTAYRESEGVDRSSLSLPHGQEELIRHVADANPNTVVVVNSGAPVDLHWHTAVPALLVSWFPGQEFGNALADVLFGSSEPGGRLPTSWAEHGEDVPVINTQPHNGTLGYTEGIHVGYRAWARHRRKPAYPFGHGLGYTSWELRSAELVGRACEGGSVVIQVRIANTGQRAGREVIQVYLQRHESSVERPTLWLAGFTAVSVPPGNEATVEVNLSARSFQHWSPDSHSWRTEPGDFTALIGHSAGNLPLKITVAAED